MIVRTATGDDMPAILEMGARFYAASGYGSLGPFDPGSAAVLADMLIETGTLLVAEVDGAAVGMAGAMVTPSQFNFSLLMAHEVMWWVDPDARSGGAGIALLDALDDACHAAGAVGLQMLVLENSPPHAVKLYESRGFHRSESCYTKRYV